MKKYLTKVILSIIMLCILFSGCGAKKVEILKGENEGISDFYIADGKVYITGEVTVRNNTEETVDYRLKGKSKKDFEIGFIKTEELNAFDEYLLTEEFNLAGNETRTFKIVLVAENGDCDEKADRLMPELYVEIIEKE